MLVFCTEARMLHELRHVVFIVGNGVLHHI